MRQPVHGVFHRRCIQPAGNRAAGLGARDEPGIGENIEMFHDGGKRNRERPRKLAHRDILLFAETGEERAARRIGERGEGAVESGIAKLNHMVKRRLLPSCCQARHGETLAERASPA
jgi:hypothetical protein